MTDVPCQQINDLAKRVEKMEGWIQDVDKRSSITEVLLEKFEIAFNKNTNVIEGIDDTLTKMSYELKNQSSRIEDLSSTTNELKTKFENSEKKFKVDFRDVLKAFLDRNSHLLIPGAIVSIIGTGLLAFIKWIVENQEIILAFLNNIK